MKLALALLLLCCTAHASNGYYFDDIHVFFPDGRAAYYFNCNVTYVAAGALTADCLVHAENQPGTNPAPPTGSERALYMVIRGGTPADDFQQWFRLNNYEGTGDCVQTATYAVPPPGTGYLVQCNGTDFIYGDTFDGSPF